MNFGSQPRDPKKAIDVQNWPWLKSVGFFNVFVVAGRPKKLLETNKQKKGEKDHFKRAIIGIKKGVSW